MKTSIQLVLIALVCSCTCAQNSWRNNDFDWKLAQKVFFNESRNVVISPFAVKLLLSLLMQSTDGITAVELQKTLMPNIKSHEIPFYFLETLAAFQQLNKSNLNIVSNVFINKDSVKVVRENFKKACQHFYKANIIEVSFRKAEKCSDSVNKWYDLMTQGHIKDVVKKDDFLSAEILFINVIYFQGNWLHPFLEKDSYKGYFKVEDKNAIEVIYMRQTKEFNFIQNGELSMVELPYRDSNLSMHVVLPNENFKLSQVLKNLNAEKFQQLKSNYVKAHVTVTIPKFKSDSNVKLKDILQQLGIQQAFSNNAEISEFQPSNLQVSDVIHSAGIIVDEQGTTGTAKTTLSLVLKTNDIVFNANKPFAYFIEDSTTGAVLFAGKIVNPVK